MKTQIHFVGSDMIESEGLISKKFYSVHVVGRINDD